MLLYATRYSIVVERKENIQSSVDVDVSHSLRNFKHDNSYLYGVGSFLQLLQLGVSSFFSLIIYTKMNT